MTAVRLDIGCGKNKKEGFVGIDKMESEGVDHVVDFEMERLPFDNHTVDEVYSFHCLEHLKDPTHVFSEIGRVCKDGAKLELWTPYAYSASAFLPDHKFFFTEEIYNHICILYPAFWHNIVQSYWSFDEILYVCDPTVMEQLAIFNIPIGFAIRHLKDVAVEFCVYITTSHNDLKERKAPIRKVACRRDGEQIDITPWWLQQETGLDFLKFHRNATPDQFYVNTMRS